VCQLSRRVLATGVSISVKVRGSCPPTSRKRRCRRTHRLVHIRFHAYQGSHCRASCGHRVMCWSASQRRWLLFERSPVAVQLIFLDGCLFVSEAASSTRSTSAPGDRHSPPEASEGTGRSGTPRRAPQPTAMGVAAGRSFCSSVSDAARITAIDSRVVDENPPAALSQPKRARQEDERPRGGRRPPATRSFAVRALRGRRSLIRRISRLMGYHTKPADGHEDAGEPPPERRRLPTVRRRVPRTRSRTLVPPDPSIGLRARRPV
jgi:hypothetical protein